MSYPLKPGVALHANASVTINVFKSSIEIIKIKNPGGNRMQ